MKRHAHVSKVKPEKLATYLDLHARPWPSVLKAISASHIENYSISLKKMPDGELLLFSYFEYTGNNWEADMNKMASDEEIQRWWDICKPCLTPIGDLPEGEVWAPLEEVFHNGQSSECSSKLAQTT